MKIIKEGEIKTKEIKKHCHKCKTIFLYTEKDIKRDREGSYVNCPKCSSFIAIETNSESKF